VCLCVRAPGRIPKRSSGTLHSESSAHLCVRLSVYKSAVLEEKQLIKEIASADDGGWDFERSVFKLMATCSFLLR